MGKKKTKKKAPRKARTARLIVYRLPHHYDFVVPQPEQAYDRLLRRMDAEDIHALFGVLCSSKDPRVIVDVTLTLRPDARPPKERDCQVIQRFHRREVPE